MAVTDFLFQGAAPIPQPTGSDTTTNFPLWLQTGIYDISNAAMNLAGTPYTPFPGQQVATPSNQTQQSWQLAGKNVGNWQPAVNAAGSELNTAGGALGAAGNAYGASGNLALSSAAPITAGDINQFFNPYTQDVIQGLETASNQNFNQNVLPQIRDQFVGSGQSGSPQQGEADARAAYLQSQALDPAIANALQQGYQGALSGAFGQRGLEQTAAGQLGNVGAGLSGIGSGYGALGAEFGQLGALGSQLSSYDVANLAAAGNAQDTVAQENINAAMRDFQNQVQWPFQTLGYASNIIRGLPTATTQQQVQTSFPPAFGPSPVATALGTAGLASSLGVGAARGGHVGALRHLHEESAHDEEAERAEDEVSDKRMIRSAISQHEDQEHEGHHSEIRLARGGALARYADGGESENSINQDEAVAKMLLGYATMGGPTATAPAAGVLPHLPPIEQRRPDLYRQGWADRIGAPQQPGRRMAPDDSFYAARPDRYARGGALSRAA